MTVALPVEIWDMILQDVSTKDLKSLCLVSRPVREQARRRMYRDITYCDAVNRSCCTRRGRSWISDLGLFYQNLVAWGGYRDVTEDVRIEWTNGIEWEMAPFKESPETEPQQRFGELVKDTAILLAQSSRLRSLHLGLPVLTTPVPFHVDRITSLRIPITGCRYKEDDPGFATLLKFFQIPTMRRVHLDCMLRLCCVVPKSCRQPGTSNVTDLTFSNCGPISEELIDLLQWPKDLRVIKFDVSDDDGTRPLATPNVSVRSEKMVNTVLPLRDSVEELQLRVYDTYCVIPAQKGAFSSFAKLTWLRIPRAVLLVWSEDIEMLRDGDFDPAPSLQTQLPATLETFEMDVGESFEWRDEEEEAENLSQNATELLTFLSGLAESERFCNLRELWLWTDDYEHWGPPESGPYHYPPDCERIQSFVTLLEACDVKVYFDGYSWSELKASFRR